MLHRLIGTATGRGVVVFRHVDREAEPPRTELLGRPLGPEVSRMVAPIAGAEEPAPNPRRPWERRGPVTAIAGSVAPLLPFLNGLDWDRLSLAVQSPPARHEALELAVLPPLFRCPIPTARLGATLPIALARRLVVPAEDLHVEHHLCAFEDRQDALGFPAENDDVVGPLRTDLLANSTTAQLRGVGEEKWPLLTAAVLAVVLDSLLELPEGLRPHIDVYSVATRMTLATDSMHRKQAVEPGLRPAPGHDLPERIEADPGDKKFSHGAVDGLRLHIIGDARAAPPRVPVRETPAQRKGVEKGVLGEHRAPIPYRDGAVEGHDETLLRDMSVFGLRHEVAQPDRR